MKLSDLNSLDLKKLKQLLESIRCSHRNKTMLQEIYYAAGSAVAIYLNNKFRNLPPVYFQIRLDKYSCPDNHYDKNAFFLVNTRKSVVIEGGRLVDSLPSSVNVLVPQTINENNTIDSLIDEIVLVFETDVINTLAGPLAAARCGMEFSNVPYSSLLVDPGQLGNYADNSTFELIRQYIVSLADTENERQEKLRKLFSDAYHFVKEPSNWAYITCLAKHIECCKKDHISCEDVASILNG